MLGLTGTPIRHIAQIDTPIIVWEINMTHFSTAGFERLMGSYHLLFDIMKYRRTRFENRLLVKHAAWRNMGKKTFGHPVGEFRQPAPVNVLVYPHTTDKQTLTTVMETCLKSL